tara:strand:+ start:88 stop:513 length:426 start_codon:yes stop_codon:yes gene_type:complete
VKAQNLNLKKQVMKNSLEERREFERIRVDLPVQYKLLTVSELQVPDDICIGETTDINPRGILLVGSLPSLDLLVPLLTQKIILSIEMSLPRPKFMVQAIARVTWIEAVEEEQKRCSMGLTFNDISQEDREKLFQFLVWQRT